MELTNQNFRIKEMFYYLCNKLNEKYANLRHNVSSVDA